jgi:hypothetical protein
MYVDLSPFAVFFHIYYSYLRARNESSPLAGRKDLVAREYCTLFRAPSIHTHGSFHLRCIYRAVTVRRSRDWSRARPAYPTAHMHETKTPLGRIKRFRFVSTLPYSRKEGIVQCRVWWIPRRRVAESDEEAPSKLRWFVHCPIRC